MLRIGILEDEKARSDELMGFLERYKNEHGSFSYSVKVYETGGKLLFDYKQDYDLLFLDIRLPDMLGIDAAREIRKIDPNVMIVFVTSLTQYAIDGYEVNAFDYILKPLMYQPFALKLTRILNILNRASAKKMLTLKTKQLTFRLDTDVILYVEVSGHNLIFHTLEREYRIWGTLSKIEQELEGGSFSRCNACYLVNLKYVDPSYQVRSAVTTANDSVYCERLGNNAVHAAMAGKTKCVVGLVHDKYVIIPTEMVTRKRNTVDPEGALWRDALDATGQPILMVNNIQSVIEHMRKTAEEEEKKAQAKSK